MKGDPDRIYYAVLLQPPKEPKELSNEVLAKHAQHLRELDQDEKLVLAGPFIDHPSGLLVLRGSNKDEIKSIMDKDPLIQGGFRSYEVRTWLMSNETNNYMP
ncbi:MAG TPA: YciI family protein [Puia sp.]|nr:YciI family protein [Puia sp.]